jgi:preprotein translocase subunit YajC
MAKKEQTDKEKGKQDAMFKRRLASLGNTFQKAQEEAKKSTRNEAAVPDGRYIVQVMDAELTVSQVTDRLQIHWVWQVREGEHAGLDLHSWDGIETEMNLTFLCRTLARLGYDIDQLEIKDLDELLADLKATQPTVRIRVRTKDEFTNIFVEKLLEAAEAEDEDEEDEKEGEEEDADEEEAEDEDEATLEIGVAVKWTNTKGEDLTGKVTEVSDTVVKVKRDDTGKVAKVPPGELTLMGTEDEEAEDEEEEEEAEEVEFPFVEGDEVTWKIGNRVQTGKVIECYEDMVRIALSDGGNVKKKISAVEKVSAEAPCEVGDMISYQYKNKTITAKVTEVLPEGKAIRGKREDNGKPTLVHWADLTVIPAEEEDADEEEADEEEEEDVEIQPGMLVSFEKAGETIEGTITKVIDDETVKVKRNDTGKVATVKTEDLTLLDAGDLDEEEEED